MLTMPGARTPPDWRERARTAQLIRRRWFFFWLVLLFAAWFGLSLLGFWVWVVLIDRVPPSEGVIALIEAVGAILSAWFARYGPVLPFRGRAPEEVAAEAFLAGEDVRSDDHKFERDLRD